MIRPHVFTDFPVCPYCRHTFAARALMAGCEPSWIAQQMGDRLETVMRHYAKWISRRP